MSLRAIYNGATDLVAGYGLAPTALQVPQRAEGGEAAFGILPFEDPESALTLTGHRPIYVEETECSQPRLFTGYVVTREFGRSVADGLIVADDRLSGVNIVDANAAAHFILIDGEDGNRPAESWNDRLAWIVASDYLSPFIGGDTEFFGDYSQQMDAADYRSGYAASVLEDLCARTGNVVTWFLFWNPDTTSIELFIKREEYTTGTSPLKISNVLSEVDNEITFAPDTLAKLARETDLVYSDVGVRYKNGTVYRTLESTATTHIKRGTVIDRPYTGSATTASEQGDRWLVAHATERDRITCTMRSVPAASVGFVRAGMGMEVNFSHLPGYESGYVTMKIVMCSPVPVNDARQDLYDIALELVGPRPTVSSDLDAWITGHHSKFYQCSDGDGEDYYGDGAELVGWESDGDSPPTGYVAMPAVGPIEYVDWPFSAETCTWMGMKVTADATVDIEVVGNFGGVASTPAATITVQVRQNGTIIGSETMADPSPRGLHGWTGLITAVVDDVEVTANDVFSVTVVFSNWVDYNYFAIIPSMLYPQSHFRITGVGDWAGTDPGPQLPTPGGTTTHTVDPTVDDDSDAGYHVGDVWVNETSGEVFILVDETPGAAVWVSITGNAADEHPQYLLRRELEQGPDQIDGVTPTGYSTTGSWSNLANATDGDVDTYASLSAAVHAAGTYYAGFQFDFGSPIVLSLLSLRIFAAGGNPNSDDGIWGNTVRVRYSDDGAAWTTLDTQTPYWTLDGADPNTNPWTTAQGFVQTAARYWEFALVYVNDNLSTVPGLRIYEAAWQEAASAQHALVSGSHRDVSTTAPAGGQALIWNESTGLWEPGAAGAGRTFAFFGG